MRGVLVVLVLLGAMAARADVYADLAGDARTVDRLAAARAEAERQRAALEQDSEALARQIEQKKAAHESVRRDLALQDLLASQRQKSDELARLAVILRGRGALLDGARKKLIADCDRALASAPPEGKRLELVRLRATQAAALSLPERPLEVARTADHADDPLWGPRELADKADLLRDSEDKLNAEVRRLGERIDSVERRRHLRERAGAVDEDLFGEATSNRHARVTSAAGDRSTTPTVGLGGTNGPPPSPAPTGSGGAGGAGGGGASGSGGGLGDHAPSTSDATVLRNLVDPATLEELRRADGSDDLDLKLRALRRARGELGKLADELGRRARALSQRADELKKKK